MSETMLEIARRVLVVVVSTAVVAASVSLYQIASSGIPFFETIPEGTVLALDSQECPSDWTEFTLGDGRFIVGRGVHSRNNAYGTLVPVKEIGATGGEDQVRLEIEHMPSHAHENPTEGGSGQGRTPALRATDNGNPSGPHRRPTGAVGGNQPHDNMPPYVVLLYCKKDR